MFITYEIVLNELNYIFDYNRKANEMTIVSTVASSEEGVFSLKGWYAVKFNEIFLKKASLVDLEKELSQLKLSERDELAGEVNLLLLRLEINEIVTLVNKDLSVVNISKRFAKENSTVLRKGAFAGLVAEVLVSPNFSAHAGHETYCLSTANTNLCYSGHQHITVSTSSNGTGCNIIYLTDSVGTC